LSSPAQIHNIVDDEPAPATEWMPVYAAALKAPPPRKIPAFLARLALGKALTEWVTTIRGASNRAAKTQLHWTPSHPTWRQGFQLPG
jgi:hypothetical protein